MPQVEYSDYYADKGVDDVDVRVDYFAEEDEPPVTHIMLGFGALRMSPAQVLTLRDLLDDLLADWEEEDNG